MQIINRLPLWQRFFLIGVLALTLGATPSYLYFVESERLLEVARVEHLGLTPIRLAMSLYKSVQDDRGLSVQLLSGVTSVISTHAAKQTEIDETITAIDAMANRDHWDSVLYEHWQDIKTDLADISTTVTQRSVTAKVTRQQHHDVIAKIHLLREHLADNYNLSIDPERRFFHIVKALTYDVVRVTDPIGLIRGSGADVLFRAHQSQPAKAKGELVTDAELINLAQRVASAREGLAVLKQSIKKSMLDTPKLKERLGTELQQVKYQTHNLAQTRNVRLIWKSHNVLARSQAV